MPRKRNMLPTAYCWTGGKLLPLYEGNTLDKYVVKLYVGAWVLMQTGIAASCSRKIMLSFTVC